MWLLASSDKAIDLIKWINNSIGISYIEFEAPSFDEAVMKLVGGNDGQN